MSNETTSSTNGNHGYVQLAADLVAAYVSNNSVPVADLPKLLNDIYGSITSIVSGTQVRGSVTAAEANTTPAVPVKKSVTNDYIVCLEDGKKYKSLKRHLRSAYDMSPEQYRAKWGLPKDYPMVAPGYAQARSDLARSMGLGRKAAESAPANDVEQPKTRGRKKAA